MGAVVLIGAAVLVVAGIGLETIGRGGLRVGGLLENPNIAAALLVATLPLVGVFWRDSNQRLWILVAIVLLGGVGLTGSRAGLLAILASSAALLPRGRVRMVGLATGAVSVAAVLLWRFASQPDILAWFRPAIWRAIVRLWSTHPLFGVGPGGLVDAAGPIRLLHEDHVGQHQFLVTYAESTPLGLLVQTGAIGLALAVVAAGLWLRRARHDGALAVCAFAVRRPGHGRHGAFSRLRDHRGRCVVVGVDTRFDRGPSAPGGGERTRGTGPRFREICARVRSCRHCSVGMCSTGVGALAVVA